VSFFAGSKVPGVRGRGAGSAWSRGRYRRRGEHRQTAVGLRYSTSISLLSRSQIVAPDPCLSHPVPTTIPSAHRPLTSVPNQHRTLPTLRAGFASQLPIATLRVRRCGVLLNWSCYRCKLDRMALSGRSLQGYKCRVTCFWHWAAAVEEQVLRGHWTGNLEGSAVVREVMCEDGRSGLGYCSARMGADAMFILTSRFRDQNVDLNVKRQPISKLIEVGFRY
jgi:hypothetical protein